MKKEKIEEEVLKEAEEYILEKWEFPKLPKIKETMSIVSDLAISKTIEWKEKECQLIVERIYEKQSKRLKERTKAIFDDIDAIVEKRLTDVGVPFSLGEFKTVMKELKKKYGVVDNTK